MRRGTYAAPVAAALLALGAVEAAAQRMPVTTSSAEARAIFEMGRTNAFQWSSVRAHMYLDAAIAFDSTFVLPYLHRAGTSAPAARGPYFERAERFRSHASEAEQKLIDAFRAFLMNDEFQLAIELLEQLAEEYPDDPHIPGYLGMRYLNHLDGYAAAASHFWKALEVDSAFTPAYQLLGWAAYFGGDLEAADKHFRESVRRAPDQPMSYYSLGAVYLEDGRYDAAIREYERALALDLHLPSSRILLAQRWLCGPLGVLESDGRPIPDGPLARWRAEYECAPPSQ
jgi:tetratricopeptide (TPR) repeat protein